MSILSASVTHAELLAVYNAERRPDDPPLDVLARHTARYALLLNRAISRRTAAGALPHQDLPIPSPWPSHVAAQYPAGHPARAQCSTSVVPLRRRHADNDSSAPDFKSLAAGAGCEHTEG